MGFRCIHSVRFKIGGSRQSLRKSKKIIFSKNFSIKKFTKENFTNEKNLSKEKKSKISPKKEN